MINQCRLCKEYFSSPLFRPYCEPHALAYEKFKKAKSGGGGNVATAVSSADRPPPNFDEKGATAIRGEREKPSTRVVVVDHDVGRDETRASSASSGEDNRSDGGGGGGGAASFVLAETPIIERDGSDRSASSESSSDGHVDVARRPPEESRERDGARLDDTPTIDVRDPRTDTPASTPRRETKDDDAKSIVESTRHVERREGDDAVVDFESKTTTPLDVSPTNEFEPSSVEAESPSKLATLASIDASTSDATWPTNEEWVDSNLRDDDDDDGYDGDVRASISRDDDGPRGVLCPISYNYYFASDDDDDDDHREDEDRAQTRILTGGNALSRLGLKPVVYAEDRFVDEDHNYLGARHRPARESEKTREAEKKRLDPFGEKKNPEEATSFSTTSSSSSSSRRFMGDEEERVDLGQLSLVHILGQIAAFPFSRETELSYFKDVLDLNELRVKKGVEEPAEDDDDDDEITAWDSLDQVDPDDIAVLGSTGTRDARSFSSVKASSVGSQKASKMGVSGAFSASRVLPSPPSRVVSPAGRRGPVGRPVVKRPVAKRPVGRSVGRPRKKRVSSPKDDDEPFYPKVSTLVHRRRKRRAEEDDQDYVPEGNKRLKRTRGLKLDYNAINEGHIIFEEARETLTNWSMTKAEKAARRLAAKEKEAKKEENVEDVGTGGEDEGKRRVTVTEKAAQRLAAKEKAKKEEDEEDIGAEDEGKWRVMAMEKAAQRLAAKEKEAKKEEGEEDIGAEDEEKRRMTATEKAAQRLAAKKEEAKKEENEDDVRAGGEDEGKRRVTATSKSKRGTGLCKVCGAECESETRIPYCKIHADLFAAFKQKQLAQLKRGHVD